MRTQARQMSLFGGVAEDAEAAMRTAAGLAAWPEGRPVALALGDAVDASLNLFVDAAHRASIALAAPLPAATRLALMRVLSSASELVGYDVKRAMSALAAAGVTLGDRRPAVFDAMVASHLLNGSAAPAPLAQLVAEAPEDGADAAQRLLIARPAMDARLRDEGESELFHALEMPLLWVLFDMERAGVAIDHAYMRQLSRDLSERMAGLEERIFAISGRAFNIGSPPQLSRMLFDELGLPRDSAYRTRGGEWSTSSWSLEDLRGAHPVVDLVLEHRGLAKLKTAYADALADMIDPADGRVHTTFNQAAVITGRLSTSNPNLQSIPIKSEFGRRVRRAFVGRAGGVVISADYSQIELRVLAHLAGDRNLIAAFERGEDIHRRTASLVYGVPLEGVTAEQRDFAKRINFGIAYGMGAPSLASSTGMSQRDAERFIAGYFRNFAQVHAWIAQTKALAARQGYVTTLMGRRRYFPRLAPGMQPSARERSRDERLAINTPVQGSAAEVVKLAMLKLHARLQAERCAAAITLQIHDELVVDCASEDAARAATFVREEMERAYPLRAPLKVDVSVGPTWD